MGCGIAPANDGAHNWLSKPKHAGSNAVDYAQSKQCKSGRPVNCLTSGRMLKEKNRHLVAEQAAGARQGLSCGL
jgi:hypothetical protein